LVASQSLGHAPDETGRRGEGEGRARVHDCQRHPVLNVRFMDRLIGWAMAELGANQPSSVRVSFVRNPPIAVEEVGERNACFRGAVLLD
jgi:hypothetical protein